MINFRSVSRLLTGASALLSVSAAYASVADYEAVLLPDEVNIVRPSNTEGESATANDINRVGVLSGTRVATDAQNSIQSIDSFLYDLNTNSFIAERIVNFDVLSLFETGYIGLTRPLTTNDVSISNASGERVVTLIDYDLVSCSIDALRQTGNEDCSIVLPGPIRGRVTSSNGVNILLPRVNDQGWIVVEYRALDGNGGAEQRLTLTRPDGTELNLVTPVALTVPESQQRELGHVYSITEGNDPIVYTHRGGLGEFSSDLALAAEDIVRTHTVDSNGNVQTQSHAIADGFVFTSGDNQYNITLLGFDAASGESRLYHCQLLPQNTCDQPVSIAPSQLASGFLTAPRLADNGVVVAESASLANFQVDSFLLDINDSSQNIRLVSDIIEESLSVDLSGSPVLALGGSQDNSFILAQSGLFGSQANTEYYLLRRQNASGAAVELTVVPETTLVNTAIQTTLGTDLLLDADALFAIEVECSTSNNTLLQLNGRSQGDFFPPSPQSLLVDTSDLNAGVFAQAVTLAAGLDDQGNFVAAPEPITAQANFASLDYLLTPLSFGIVDINCTALASESDGTSRSVSVLNATVTLDNGVNDPSAAGHNVSGIVDIPVGVNPADVTVSLTVGDVTLTTSVDENGFFVFENIASVNGVVTAQSPRTVAECSNFNVAGEAVDLGNLTLFRGDITNDGVIDIADVTFLSSRFGLSEGDRRYRERVDLNRDGTINVQDLAILASALGREACDVANN